MLHDIAHIVQMADFEHRSSCEKNYPYLTFKVELWVTICQFIGEQWPWDIESTLYYIR